MLKKITLWTLVAGFSGLLIFGAINRTNIKLDNEDHERVLNSENENGNPSAQSGQYGNQEENPSGNPGGRGQGGRNISSLDSSGDNLVEDNWGSSQVRYLESECDEEDHEGDHVLTTLSGVVSSIDFRTLLVDTTDGQIEISGRAWRFAQEQNLSLSVGDQIILNGFFEDGEYKVAELKNVSNGQIVSVRDANGHPLWGGGGNG